jgi:hypothetical protein
MQNIFSALRITRSSNPARPGLHRPAAYVSRRILPYATSLSPTGVNVTHNCAECQVNTSPCILPLISHMRLRSYNYPIPRVPPTPIPVYITSPLNTSQSTSSADFTSARAFADKKISQRVHTVSTMYLHCNALILPSKYRRPCRIASGTQTPRLGPLDPAHLTAKTSARLRVL